MMYFWPCRKINYILLKKLNLLLYIIFMLKYLVYYKVCVFLKFSYRYNLTIFLLKMIKYRIKGTFSSSGCWQKHVAPNLDLFGARDIFHCSSPPQFVLLVDSISWAFFCFLVLSSWVGWTNTWHTKSRSLQSSGQISLMLPATTCVSGT